MSLRDRIILIVREYVRAGTPVEQVADRIMQEVKTWEPNPYSAGRHAEALLNPHSHADIIIDDRETI